jgi:transposase
MLQVNAQTKIYISTFAVDFRLGIDGLCAMIKSQFNLDPMDGALFAFTNNRKSGIKFIIYDGQGYWFCYKRLSQGRIQWWPSGSDAVVPLDARNLLLLIYNGDPLKVQFQGDWRKI